MNDESIREHFEERAAIMQYDGLMTREEAERLGMLDSEHYRYSSEIRTIAEWELPKRRTFLADVEQKRGKEAAQKLRDGLMLAWLERKAKKEVTA